MVPVMAPVAELIDKPLGRPVAVYVRVAPEIESEAEMARSTAWPSVPVWSPGLVTETGDVTVQANVVLPVYVPSLWPIR